MFEFFVLATFFCENIPPKPLQKEGLKNLSSTKVYILKIHFHKIFQKTIFQSNATFHLLIDEIVFLRRLAGSLIKAIKQTTINDDKQKINLLLVDLRTVWFYTAGENETVNQYINVSIEKCPLLKSSTNCYFQGFNLQKDAEKFKQKLVDAFHPDRTLIDPIKPSEFHFWTRIDGIKCKLQLNLVKNLPELTRTIPPGRFPYTSVI